MNLYDKVLQEVIHNMEHPKDHNCIVESGVKFDYSLASNMETSEIKKKWPRKVCTKCGSLTYESMSHKLLLEND